MKILKTMICAAVLVAGLTTVSCNKKAPGKSFQEQVENSYRLIEEKDYDGIRQSLSSLYETYIAENDPLDSISRELRILRKQDQGIRLIYMDATSRYSRDDSRLAAVRSVMDSIDRENEKRAILIIQKYGWLTREDVGEDAAEALFLIVQHCADTKLQQDCLPKLKAAVEKDPSIAWQYAFLVDRTAMNLGKEQTYGTQKIIVDGIPYPAPIKDVDQLDARRAEMGLDAIWEELNDEYGSDWSLTKYKENIERINEVYRNYLQKRIN